MTYDQFQRDEDRGLASDSLAAAWLTHYSVAVLKRRGWTPTLIRQFLGEADHTAANPRSFKTNIKLYAKTRVHRIEQLPDWKEAAFEAAQRAMKRKEQAQ